MEWDINGGARRGKAGPVNDADIEGHICAELGDETGLCVAPADIAEPFEGICGGL